MAQVDEAEVTRGKRAFLRAQIQQAHVLLNPSQRSAPPPCSAAGVGGWWALRVKENFVAEIWKMERPPLYFLEQAEEIAPKLEVIARNVEKGLPLGPLRRAVHGAWKLLEVAPQGRAKAATVWRDEAEKTFRLAQAAREKAPSITRRQLLRALMITVCGEDAIKHDGHYREARDPVYRAAYDEVRRSLKRGFELAGSPAEFRHLIARS